MRKSLFEFKGNKKFWGIIFLIYLAIVIITLSTKYYGSGDIGDYANVAKFFAGKNNADIRSSHSYLYGFIHAPFISLFNNLVIFKITSLIFLGLIILSVYYISGKNKIALLLILFSPIIWYMSPWISPIQLASLLLLWAFYFINRYDEDLRIRYLFFSAILIGLGWAIWDTILFFGLILGLSFLFNKKLSHSIYFVLFVFVGLIPRLILDQILFNFAFFTIIKSFFGTSANLFGGIYGKEYGHAALSIITIFLVFLIMPLNFWKLYNPKRFFKLKKNMIFLTLSLLLLLANLQLRYIMALLPIIIILSSRGIEEKHLKVQIPVFLILIVIFISPYIMQTKFGINDSLYGAEITEILQDGLNINPRPVGEVLANDLSMIVGEFPDKSFIVGNNPDDYRALAYYYWGSDVKEFVSIQDYKLWLNNETILFSRRFEPIPNINERRQIWIEGGISRNHADGTDFDSLKYAIIFSNQSGLEDFHKIRQYEILSIWEKS